jgi:hypothetical protein
MPTAPRAPTVAQVQGQATAAKGRMSDRADVEAAIEMVNEGFGMDALTEVMRCNHIRAIQGGFEVVTDDGVVGVMNSGNGTLVINGRTDR